MKVLWANARIANITFVGKRKALEVSIWCETKKILRWSQFLKRIIQSKNQS